MISTRTRIRAGIASALVGALTAGGLLLGVGTASATPSHCTKHKSDTKASVRCTSGTGTYRIVVNCVDRLGGGPITVYGMWVTIGRTSAAQCPAGETISSVGVQER